MTTNQIAYQRNLIEQQKADVSEAEAKAKIAKLAEETKIASLQRQLEEMKYGDYGGKYFYATMDAVEKALSPLTSLLGSASKLIK